jgi:CheY-like chemotaxis protein
MALERNVFVVNCDGGAITGMDPKRKLVYVVEDDEEQLYVMRILLSDAGFDVVTEADADRVLEGVQALTPDVILLDVMLPSHTGLDGFELCSRIRQLPHFSETVILIISAIAEGAGRFRDKMTEQVGANDFIVKPYDPPLLVQRIRELLQ